MSHSSRKPQPLALTPALPSELITYILNHQTYPTTLIICQSRANFLSSLQRCLPGTVQRQPPLYVEQSSSGLYRDGAEQQGPARQAGIEKEAERQDKREDQQPTTPHPLLIATLHQLVSSRFVNLVFTPTLSHLRAYLSVFSGKSEKGEKPPEQKFEKIGNRTPLLVVYGLVAAHRDTSEWSAQGLGSSVAALMEAGNRGWRKVVVIEEREWDGEGNDEGEADVGGGYGEEREERESRSAGWEERLPMLNGSVKRIGLESEDGGWSGRTVEVGRVLGRWFRFRRGEWDDYS